MIIYGCGREAEEWLYRNNELISEIRYYIDRDELFFHGNKVFRIEELSDEQLSSNYIIVTANEHNYMEISLQLKKRGLQEFANYCWSYAYGKKIVLFHANCYKTSIINTLNMSSIFRKEYFIYPTPLIHNITDRRLSDTILKNIDYYIHQDIRKENSISYELSDEYIRKKLRKDVIDITIPNCVELGYGLYPNLDNKEIRKVGGWFPYYHDQIIEKAYISGCNRINEYISYYKGYKFQRDYIYNNFELYLKKIECRQQNWDIEIYDYICENVYTKPTFIDHRHLASSVMIHIVKQLAKVLGIEEIDTSNYRLQMGCPVPVHPSVKECLGIHYTDLAEKLAWSFESSNQCCDIYENYIRPVLFTE